MDNYSKNRLPISGGYNFRDLGGFAAAAGRTVRRGLVFRAGDLRALGEKDIKLLSGIPIITIVDFRSEGEFTAAPDIVPPGVKYHFNLAVRPGSINLKDVQSFTKEQGFEHMLKVYRTLVSDREIVKRYKEFFTLLQSGFHTPLLFHCAAGKDRTGLAAALFLYSLGVSDEDIMKDYLKSNSFLADKYAEAKKKYPALESLLEVRSELLQSALDIIKEQHGSIENYLTQTLKVDLDKMKELYLK